MLIYRILLGIAGLGIVVFIHELGHFLAARLTGIEVEALSIGWGKPFLKKKIGKVEYRLGIFPLGGYCKMKGETNFENAYNKNLENAKTEDGSFFSAHPFKRIVTSFAGPFFNFVFALLVFTVIWGIGFEVNTSSNRVILTSSEITSGITNPAEEAGILTGDRIVSIDGQKTENFKDIQESILFNPGEVLNMEIDRDGNIIEIPVRSMMDKNSGAGMIGIRNWTDPVIHDVADGGPAHAAGLMAGDIILTANGVEIPNTISLGRLLEDKPYALNIEYLRDSVVSAAEIIPVYNEDGAASLGISWEVVRFQTPRLSVPAAITRGTSEAWRIFTMSIKSLSFLFRGVDPTKAVSGPIRITYMIGDVAAAGFSQSFAEGISSMANFLALISIALCLMNLLPLPVMDGGMILLFLAEAIRGKMLPPRFVSAFQTAGMVLIAGLIFFVVFADIRYFAGR